MVDFKSYRWSQHVLWTFEHIRTYRYVLVLLVLGTRSAIPEILVVEKVSHCTPNGEYSTILYGCRYFSRNQILQLNSVHANQSTEQNKQN